MSEDSPKEAWQAERYPEIYLVYIPLLDPFLDS